MSAPDDPDAVAADDQFVEQLRRGEHPLDDPVAPYLAAWVSETRAGSDVAKRDESDRDTKYRIRWTSRPPMADAGVKRTAHAQGRAGKNAACTAIREGHGQVLRVESKKPGAWFYW